MVSPADGEENSGGEGYGWIPKPRDYSEERSAFCRSLSSEVVNDHPLLNTKGSEDKKSDQKAQVASISDDPLGGGDDDPLGALLAGAEDETDKSSSVVGYASVTSATVSKEQQAKTSSVLDEESGWVPWRLKKPEILKKYTTNERLAIKVDFLDETPQQRVPTDKIKDRLEELEEAENASQQVLKLSQKEYIAKINGMHTELLEAWNSNQRVLSLKIVIQCSKLLGDTSVIKFYPSKFVLITEILDTFGSLVFERLKGRSVTYDNYNQVPRTLPEEFQSADVTPQARETARNWFYKIASIRELLPRLYVELAILQCYRFLTDEGWEAVIVRLASMIRGIGNPLVAAYARAYLARAGRRVLPNFRDYQLSMFYDFVDTDVKLKRDGKMEKLVKKSGLDTAEYCGLYSPAIDWMLQCIAHRSERKVLTAVLRKYKEDPHGLLLNHVMTSFQPSYISPNALALTVLIRETDTTSFPQSKLFATLGVNLCLSAPSSGDVQTILNDVWKVVTEISDAAEYISVAEVWIEYPLLYCSQAEVNTMIADILEHVSKDHAYEDLQGQLASVAQKILSHIQDFRVLFGMEKFLRILDLFRGETRVEVNKAVLKCFAKGNFTTSDPVIISAMFEVGKTVHDSINALSFKDEVKQISYLISQFIRKVDMGRDFEKQLTFYVECRRAFTNLDSVKGILVVSTAGLAVRTFNVVKGEHTKKTSAFVRACVAFCFITIPAMDGTFARLYLYLLSAQVALTNRALPQGEALLKAAIALLQEVERTEDIDGQVRSTSEDMYLFTANLCSQLVVLPGHPQHGPFYLLKGLIQVLDDHKWEAADTYQALSYNRIIQCLSACSQKRLIYHVEGVESNDVLYQGDPDYQAEILELIEDLVSKVMTTLNTMQSDSDVSAKRRLVDVALDLLSVTISHARLTPQSASFAANLYSMAKKSGAKNKQLHAAVGALKRGEQGSIDRELYAKLTR